MPLVTNVSSQDIDRLLAPIDPKLAAGLFDIEDETYQAIDQEMVKLGGLHEASIDWPYIEEASRQYLSTQCKHLRIVSHLNVVWLRSGCWQRWCHSLVLLAGMVERYWQTAHPKPGPTGFPGKRKLVERALTHLADALSRLDRFSHTPACVQAAQAALASLQRQAAETRLDPAALNELERLLLTQAGLAAGGQGDPAVGNAMPPVTAAPLAEAFLPARASLSLGNERETRRAVLGMADFINQQDLYDPTGYQLRRFGLWGHLQAAPSAKRERRTELMAVPTEISAGYEEALGSTAIDPALLLRVEKSVAAAPYWIRGSFLAAAIAARLELDEVAEAIRCATARFVRRLPTLQQLCFSDGTAFVDEQCLAWLKGAEARPAQDAPAQEFHGLRRELSCQLETDGVEPVLLRLQGLQSGYRSLRERCHSTVIAADLLAVRGVSWLAQDLCASVAGTMQVTSAAAWEPEVYQKLVQYAATSALMDRNEEP